MTREHFLLFSADTLGSITTTLNVLAETGLVLHWQVFIDPSERQYRYKLIAQHVLEEEDEQEAAD